MTVSGLKLHTT